MYPKEADLLHQWVSEAIGGKVTFKLLWQGSRDGFSASTFHTKCNGQGPTLSIGLSTFPKIFGGFTSENWEYNGGNYRSDSTAFIFSLTHRIKCAKQKNGSAIYPHPSYGPTFGNGHDINFSSDCNKNNHSYYNGNNATKFHKEQIIHSLQDLQFYS